MIADTPVPGDTLSGKIADFVVNTRFSDLPDKLVSELITVMQLSVLDWCTVSLAGTDEPVSRIVRQMLLTEGGHEQSLVIGETRRLPMRAAALANGTTSHALDYDDTHFLHVGHTSVVILSAAMAAGQAGNVSMRGLLEASIIGTEVACYTGHWLGRSHYEAGFHQSATAGTFGAVAATARLLQLDAEQTQHALGLATTRASGLTSQFGTMGKPFNAGMAAANGIEATLLAAMGFVSRPDALECPQGFATSHHGQVTMATDAKTDPGSLSQGNPMAKLGKDFVSVEVKHKFHACCHGLHACIEALIELRDEHAILSDDIRAIRILTNPRWMQVCNQLAPRTGLEAKFSYRFVSAIVFSELDTAALTTYTDANCHDPELQLVKERTHVAADAKLSDTAARVTVMMNDGRELSATHDIAAPLDIATRQVKVLRKSAILLGETTSQSLWSTIVMQGGQDLSSLLDAIAKARETCN
ncbi:MAG: MmgE/PrpD family protein [Granulosicoccus sp.]|nr:MmgE/PrpD family protein [Granulosicoccus sp.]